MIRKSNYLTHLLSISLLTMLRVFTCIFDFMITKANTETLIRAAESLNLSTCSSLSINAPKLLLARHSEIPLASLFSCRFRILRFATASSPPKAHALFPLSPSPIFRTALSFALSLSLSLSGACVKVSDLGSP